jgi:hypothetical protein
MRGGSTDDVAAPTFEDLSTQQAPSSTDANVHYREVRDVVILPESLSYRLKKALLGPPLVYERR